jgi:hypothetical protein
MNWSFRVDIITVSKMQMDWMERGTFMAYYVAYLAKTYNIPPCFLVNTDQIGMHMGCWHGGVNQFQHHKGIFFVMGVIASTIFCNAKNIKSHELWTFEIEKLGCNPI